MPETNTLISEQCQRVIDHMVARVNAVEMSSDPYPHFFVRELFPPDFYAKLIDSLPSPDEYEAFALEKYSNTEGASVRKRFSIENDKLDRLPAEQREMWTDVRAAFGSPELKDAVYRKLGPGLGVRFDCSAEEAAQTPGFALPELYRETAAYCIKPHPDTRKKVVTMQVSLARDNSQENLGTEFYRRSLRPSAWLREPKGFEIAKVMQFLPNAAYAFVVLNKVGIKSWHGRTTLQEASGVRNSILNIWYAKAEDGHKDLFGQKAMQPEAAASH